MIWPRLSIVDSTLLGLYVLAMIVAGALLARRQDDEDDYFLAGRRMPWWTVSISVVASMISSLTYLAMPGEAWKSGVTHVVGKVAGILLSILPVWAWCIPALTRMRYTSAYEYLEDRFGHSCRRLGALLFLVMMMLWLGFVVLTLARVFHQVAHVPLIAVILTVGLVATLYTFLGGLRAVIWTDLLQVGLLLFGALATILYVAWTTGSWLPDWLQTTDRYLVSTGQPQSLPWFSIDPTVRATVVTVTLNMAVWQICMHSSNQITLQRYFATSNPAAARKSFLASAVANLVVSLVLITVGLAVLHYYVAAHRPLDGGLTVETGRDLIFPTFAALHLPTGAAGGMLVALLAAAMSTVDSGVNCMATVMVVEGRRGPTRRPQDAPAKQQHAVRRARGITFSCGLVIVLVAIGLDQMPGHWSIMGVIPRTFNAITGPLGGLFLIGLLVPGVRQPAAVTATLLGIATSLVLGYLHQLGLALGVAADWPDISFTWIMPSAFLATMASAVGLQALISASAPLIAWMRAAVTDR